MGKPMLEAQESPPFERPSIEQVTKASDSHTHTHAQYLAVINVYVGSQNGSRFIGINLEIQPGPNLDFMMTQAGTEQEVVHFYATLQASPDHVFLPMVHFLHFKAFETTALKAGKLAH